MHPNVIIMLKLPWLLRLNDFNTGPLVIYSHSMISIRFQLLPAELLTKSSIGTVCFTSCLHTKMDISEWALGSGTEISALNFKAIMLIKIWVKCWSNKYNNVCIFCNKKGKKKKIYFSLRQLSYVSFKIDTYVNM